MNLQELVCCQVYACCNKKGTMHGNANNSMIFHIDGWNHLVQMIRNFFLCQLLLLRQSCFIILSKRWPNIMNHETYVNFTNGWTTFSWLSNMNSHQSWCNGKTIRGNKNNEKTRSLWISYLSFIFIRSNIVFILLKKRISVILTTQPYSPQIGKTKTLLLANVHLVHLKNRPFDLALLPMMKPKLMPDTQVQLVENSWANQSTSTLPK